MPTKVIKTRIKNLYKTEQDWQALPDFVPLSGEIIYYAPDRVYSYVRIKIGDGNTYLSRLPFEHRALWADLAEEHIDGFILDCGEIE